MNRLTIVILTMLLASNSLALPSEPDTKDEHQHLSIGGRIAEWMNDKGVPEEAVIVMVAALPIVELRGAIPIGIILFEMRDRWWLVYILAVAGNMIPIPIILLSLGPISKACMRFRWGRIFFEWLFARTRRKSASIEKYETLGLSIFVAIPLPVTGGWTGSMAAFLMGVKFRHAIFSILLGVVIAGAIMTTLSLLGWWGAAIAAVVLIGLAVSALQKMFKGEEKATGRDLNTTTGVNDE
jgi:uncharacterized membrane protein